MIYCYVSLLRLTHYLPVACWLTFNKVVFLPCREMCVLLRTYHEVWGSSMHHAEACHCSNWRLRSHTMGSHNACALLQNKLNGILLLFKIIKPYEMFIASENFSTLYFSCLLLFVLILDYLITPFELWRLYSIEC